MCGFFGSADRSGVDLFQSRSALDTLIHRGPDQGGEYVDRHVYMGHRRLSILDLSENAKQPMESQRTVITVNGEVYNFLQLKSKLSSKYAFKSGSDSEVLLHGYEEWGLQGLLDRIDGMYAIVIYDKKQRTIHLVRDRYGVKPIYYCMKGNVFCWGSELKSIRAFVGESNLEVDHTSVYDYLTYLYVPSPKTLYSDIYKLPPAHYLTYDLDNSKTVLATYWRLPIDEKQVALDDAAERVRHLISKSVGAQMISDVPVGFFLSGGIDSSIVVSSATECSNSISTYSIGFDVGSHNETAYASIVADTFRTCHHEKILKLSDANRFMEQLVNWYDEPFADTSAFPTFLVSQYARGESTVVLSGDGGDEIFGGYTRYQRFSHYRKHALPILVSAKTIIAKLKRSYRYQLVGRAANQLEYHLCNDMELYAKLMGGLLKHEKRAFAAEWNIPDDYNDYWYFEKFYLNKLGPRKRLQYLDFHTYLPDDIFTKVDRVTMSVSLECRVPFLERELVEFAFSLPEEIIYFGNSLKGLLKYAFRNVLPDAILDRPKSGFNIPLREWNREFLGDSCTQQERILEAFRINGI